MSPIKVVDRTYETRIQKLKYLVGVIFGNLKKVNKQLRIVVFPNCEIDIKLKITVTYLILLYNM